MDSLQHLSLTKIALFSSSSIIAVGKIILNITQNKKIDENTDSKIEEQNPTNT